MSISGRRVRSRGLVAIGAAVSLAIYMAVIALPASAAVTCVVTGTSPNQVMTVTLDADTDTATLVVNGANIDFNGWRLPAGRDDRRGVLDRRERGHAGAGRGPDRDG